MLTCVIGSDGRAHALAHRIHEDGNEVVCTPGNAGNPYSIATPYEEIDADLFVFSAEQPLVEGAADRLRAKGKLVFGPGADGARLEGSKAEMKRVVRDAGLPSAAYGVFHGPVQEMTAISYAQEMIEIFGQTVIKTDGLAGGKGVLVTGDPEEASKDILDKFRGESFDGAGTTIVIEEPIPGPELSVFLICDGKQVRLINAYARDYKRAEDDDQGPNTGGMGCYSPVDISEKDSLEFTIQGNQLVQQLIKEGIDYRGFLYMGYKGGPDKWQLLEINVRFGDPEAEVILPRISNGFSDVIYWAAKGSLEDAPGLEIGGDAVVAVAICAPGYPENAVMGGSLHVGLPPEDSWFYFAGVAPPIGEESYRIAGGRALYAVGRAPTTAEARSLAYELVDRVGGEVTYRTDIALNA